MRLGRPRTWTARTWLGAGAVVALLLALAIAIASYLRPDPSLGDRLADSLAHRGDGFAVDRPCEAAGDGRWQCTIADDPSSGASDVYLLRLSRDECWSGARTQDAPGDQPLRGCLDRR
jgi:hypothetical protein